MRHLILLPAYLIGALFAFGIIEAVVSTFTCQSRSFWNGPFGFECCAEVYCVDRIRAEGKAQP